jgi:hypothetical protein
MIRRVAFGKAVMAGAAGALAWEICVRLLLFAGLPLFDITRTLGRIAVPGADAPVWWPIGVALHLGVGAVWAVFYAYFFWSTLNRPPSIQGLVFSLLPTILAGLIMVPQLGHMDQAVLSGAAPHPGLFAYRLGWGGPVGVILGHLIYGLAMGSLYVRPVGARVSREMKHA